MKRWAWLSLIAVVVIAFITLTILAWGAIVHSDVMPVSDRVAYFKIYADLAQIVVVGFGAALLAILIPTIVSEARMSFERLKDSRTAYSEAKTGIDYLPLRICTVNLKIALALIQRVHVKKHQAELFPELAIHLKRRGITRTPDQWGDSIYAKCFALRSLLERNADKWDSLTPSQRLTLIREILPTLSMEPLVPGSIDSTELRIDAAQPSAPADAPRPAGSGRR